MNQVRRTSRAKLVVHELDAGVIERFEERLSVAASDIEQFWIRGGVPAEQRAAMREMYEASKRVFRSEAVDIALRDQDLVGPGYRVHHVPGHCPGLVCLEVHDVLLTSDHVLARITPHQFPHALDPFGGLERYFQSLEKIRRVEGIRLALGGHEDPIADLHRRIAEIEQFHRARLDRVLAICDVPRTVHEIANELFGEQEGYGVILAHDEAGAHVEHLHAHGRVRAEETGTSGDRVIRYVARSLAA